MPDHENSIPNKGEIVTSLGMTYIHIPVAFDAPDENKYEMFCPCMDALIDQRVWVHCIVNARVSAFLFRYLQARRGHSSAPSARTGSLKTERACSRVAQYVHRRVRRRRPYWTRCLAHWKRGWPNTHGSAETPLQSLTSLSITRGDERSNNSCQRQYRIWKAARAFSACRIFTRFKVNQRAA